MKNIIFRPTNNCNLACKYCYDKNNHVISGLLQEEATEKFLNNKDKLLNGIYRLFKDEDSPKLIFHGGEPLLIKSEVLDSFCCDLDKDFNIRYAIQTNGTLIGKNAINLFKKHDFSVGVSLDGCNEDQNSARVFINNNNSFNSVMKKIKLLQDSKVRFGIIMSISKKHLFKEQEIYDFIGDNHFRCNIRPVFDSSDEFKDLILCDMEYINFFNKLFDIWYNDYEKKVGTFQIFELYDALKEELDPDYRPSLCNGTRNCFSNFISLDVDGNLYSCNRLYGLDKFYYGNVNSINNEELYKKINILNKEIEEAVDLNCGNCVRLNICNGGCVAENYNKFHSLDRVLCDKKVKKLIKQHIKETIKNDL